VTQTPRQAHLRANPEQAQVVLRRILPKRITVTPTPSGGSRFHAFADYTQVL